MTNKSPKHTARVIEILSDSPAERIGSDLFRITSPYGKYLRDDIKQALRTLVTFMDEMRHKPLGQITVDDLGSDIYLADWIESLNRNYKPTGAYRLNKYLVVKAHQKHRQPPKTS